MQCAGHDGRRLRLFAAIEIPNELKVRLGEAQALLKRTALHAGGASWTKPEQMHLTLRFFGGVPGGRVAEISARMQTALRGLGAFQLRSRGLGFFPNPERARVVWAGLEGDLGRLGAAREAVENAVGQFAAEPAEMKFAPHLTLARVKRLPRGMPGALAAAATALAAEIFGEWTVQAVHLYQSVLGSGGATHTILSTATL